jgi:hypothetical protein
MSENKTNSRRVWRQVLGIRIKQFATTFFVIVTSTLMIQNVWYPESFSAFKKSWRAGVGALIFLMGFAVARALFDIYGEQVRNIKTGRNNQSGEADSEHRPEAPEEPAEQEPVRDIPVAGGPQPAQDKPQTPGSS